MGADGGVVYVAVKDGTEKSYNRVVELLSPFWQFLSQDGCAFYAQKAHNKWHYYNISIYPPKYILGYYGTDRFDNFNLEHLETICEKDPEITYVGDLYSYTFDELDIDCRTSNITGSYNDHILYRLWYQHFKYSSREEVLKQFGSLSSVKISDWAKELRELLDIDHITTEETWT
jgi:hypothetical protein